MARPRDRAKSRRRRQQAINRQSKQLVARKPKRWVNAQPFRIACQCIRKRSGKQEFRAMRTQRGQWFFNGERTISFVNWNGALINRNHARTRGRQITICGIAFPINRFQGSVQPERYGINKNPNLAMTMKKALMGDKQALADWNGYNYFIDNVHNAKIDSAVRYYVDSGKYHRIYNPHGLDSRFREVKQP